VAHVPVALELLRRRRTVSPSIRCWGRNLALLAATTWISLFVVYLSDLFTTDRPAGEVVRDALVSAVAYGFFFFLGMLPGWGIYLAVLRRVLRVVGRRRRRAAAILLSPLVGVVILAMAGSDGFPEALAYSLALSLPYGFVVRIDCLEQPPPQPAEHVS
jgi:hypothetical protein